MGRGLLLALALAAVSSLARAQQLTMNWFPHGRLPLARVCANDTGGAGAPATWLPHRFLALGHLQYVIVGLRAASGEHTLLGDVLWSGDGGGTWQCLSVDSAVASRAGAEPFILSTAATVASDSSSGGGVVQLDALCVSGGRELLAPAPGGDRQYSAPLDSVVCASLTASLRAAGAAARLAWHESARLPSGSIGHVHSAAALLLPGASTPLLVGGERRDDSDDLWIPITAAIATAAVIVNETSATPAAAAASLQAALQAHALAPGPVAWARLPLRRLDVLDRPATLKRSTVTWYPGPRLLFVLGGVTSLGGREEGAQFAPCPVGEVNQDTGGWLGESTLIDTLFVELPPLTQGVLAALASPPEGGAARPNGTVEATQRRTQLQMPEPPGAGAASFAYSLGVMNTQVDGVAPESLVDDPCVVNPSQWCAVLVSQVGSRTYVRSVSNFSASLAFQFFRYREHVVFNGSGGDPLLAPPSLDEAPGALLGVQATWAQQQSLARLAQESDLGLAAALSGSWFRGNSSAGAVDVPGEYGHILVANAQTGQLFRGTGISCQRNFSCPPGWYVGGCTSGPYSSQCHPCAGGANPLCASVGGGDGAARGSGSAVSCAVLRWSPALAAAVLALALALLGVAGRLAWGWWQGAPPRILAAARSGGGAAACALDDGAAAGRRVEAALAAGLLAACQLGVLGSALASAHAAGCVRVSSSSSSSGGAQLYATILAVLLLGPVVAAVATSVVSCVLPSLRPWSRVLEGVAARGWWRGAGLALLTAVHPWLLVGLLVGQPAGRRPAGVAATAERQGQREFRLALAAVAGAHALLVELPLCALLFAAYAARHAGATADVTSQASVALALAGVVQLLLLVHAAWDLSHRLQADLAGAGRGAGGTGAPHVEVHNSLSAVARIKSSGHDFDPLPTADDAPRVVLGSDEPAAGVAAGRVEAARAPSALPPPVQQQRQLPVSISDLWRLAVTPEGCALANQGLFFRTKPHLVSLAASAVQSDPLPEPWLKLLRRLEALAAQPDSARYWPLAAAAADELVLSLGEGRL